MNKFKNWFFDMINKINKIFLILIKENWEENIYKIRSIKEIISLDKKDIKIIIK